MNKEQFNKLDIDKQVSVVNDMLVDLGSVNQVCKHIGIAKSTVRDRFKAKNYYYDLEDKKYKLKVEVIQETGIQYAASKDTIQKDENNRIKEYDTVKQAKLQEDESSNIVVIDGEEQQNLVLSNKSAIALDFITENFSKIQNLVNNIDVFERNQMAKDVIIPNFEGDNIRTTIKVNELIWNEFSEFASMYKQYAKQDIISLAFKEFIDNHKDK